MRVTFCSPLIFLIIFYHIYFSNARLEERYAQSEAPLDPRGDLLLKWRVDYLSKKIKFTVKVSRNAPMFTWLAIGFSDRGALNNSDICLIWTDFKGRDHFEDMNADDKGKLIRDTNQDCNNFHVDSQKRSIIFERAFDTCDKNDYVIKDETVHVVWARGDDRLFSSKGLCLSCTSSHDHGFIRVRLLTPSAFPEHDARELQFNVNNLKVPEDDTTYWCKVIKLPEFLTAKTHQIVQYQSHISPGNEGLVHHMELFYCDEQRDQGIPLYEGNCFSPDRPNITKVCSKVKAAWAMGATPFIYPPETGLPFGGPDKNKYVMLEVHYNNPELLKDVTDSSGIRIYVTANKRRYDAGIMELGIEYTDKMAIPGRQKDFRWSGHCVPQCTASGLPDEGIIVFGSQLHTHLTGVAVWTRHVRRGVELPYLNRDMHYSTHFQEIRILHRPVKVLPGDYLQTTCIFNTEHLENATIGGHAISDEMCVNYIHYYPVTDLEVCKSAISNIDLENYFKFEDWWDKMPISYDEPPRYNYMAIHPWTPLRAEALTHLYSQSTLSMQCNKSDGTRFQGEWEGVAIPKIMLPLPDGPENCTDIRHYLN